MLIKDNAYLILWLLSSENDLTINKRYHELEKLSKVKLTKPYQYDLSFVNYKKLRTLDNVKESFHNLTDQNNRIYHFFFWFDLTDEKNLDIFNIYKEGHISEALEWWKSEYNSTLNTKFLMNYVIWALLAIELENKNISNQLLEELVLKIPFYIQKILSSDDFINQFYKRYNDCSSIKTSKAKINEFFKALPQYICEQFFTLWEQHWTFFLYKWICELYQISSERVNSTDKVLDEYENIDKNYTWLKNSYAPDDLKDIISATKNIINSLNELSSLGVKDNPKLWKLRDGIAEYLINISSDLHDEELYDDEVNILTFAKKIAYSNRVKDKIIINKNNKVKEEKINEPVENKVENVQQEPDKLRDETNYLISSIYLSLDVIKRPLLLNNYSKLLEEISKVNDMIKKIEESNLVKEEYVIKIRDNIWEAILVAATQFYTEYWSYEKAYKLLQMAKKMARSRWILNKIIVELNIMDDSERKIKWEEKKSTTYAQSNVKKNDDSSTEENKTNNTSNDWKWFAKWVKDSFMEWFHSKDKQWGTNNKTNTINENSSIIWSIFSWIFKVIKKIIKFVWNIFWYRWLLLLLFYIISLFTD